MYYGITYLCVMAFNKHSNENAVPCFSASHGGSGHAPEMYDLILSWVRETTAKRPTGFARAVHSLQYTFDSWRSSEKIDHASSTSFIIRSITGLSKKKRNHHQS